VDYPSFKCEPETWYEHYSIGRHPHAIVFYFLQANKNVRWDQYQCHILQGCDVLNCRSEVLQIKLKHNGIPDGPLYMYIDKIAFL
jgi:hypothetical protein